MAAAATDAKDSAVAAAAKPGPLHFYDADAPYYELTNFFAAPIVVGGATWPTSEHYFQVLNS